MSEKLFSICSFVAPSDSDYKLLLEHLGNHPVSIIRELPEELYFDIPTILVGWNNTKEKFSNQNIFDKEICKNLFWCFSQNEDSKKFYYDVDDFFSSSIKKWLPTSFKIYDSFLNKESLKDFYVKNINIDKEVYSYFHQGALYLFNDDNNFAVNIKSLAALFPDFKNILSDVFNSYKTCIVSYDNAQGYINYDVLKPILCFETLRWVKYSIETPEIYFQIVPNFDVSKYIPFLLSRIKLPVLTPLEETYYARMCDREKITCWLSSREIAFDSSYKTDKLQFKLRRNYKLAKVHYSNKRTITGRILAKDNYNPQNLEKNNDDRTKIISRFEDGYILAFDYISFEPKIAIYLSGDDSFIENYYSKDIHYEAGILLFDVPELEPGQRKFAKSIVNPLLYGAGDDLLLKNLAEQFSNPQEQLQKIRKFLKPILGYSEQLKKFYKHNGYLVTPWGSIIKPEKEFAYFNNFMQAFAAEIIVDKIIEIKELLKNYKSQFLFQVHDSLILDLHPDEKFLIRKISKILSYHKNMIFSLSYSAGHNYKDLTTVFNIVAE